MEITAVIFLANGFEDCEALLVVDLLRRAQIQIETISLEKDRKVQTSHGVTLWADTGWQDFLEAYTAGQKNPLWWIIPGGLAGTNRLKSCSEWGKELVQHVANNGQVAAICAGPTVLSHFGLLRDCEATCYPGCQEEFHASTRYCSDRPVVRSGAYLTSQGLGTAIPFALALIAEIQGEERAQTIARQILA